MICTKVHYLIFILISCTNVHSMKQIIYTLINNPNCRARIALALNISEQSVRLAIKHKRDNLTKKKALDVIKEITGLTEEELFETEKSDQ